MKRIKCSFVAIMMFIFLQQSCLAYGGEETTNGNALSIMAPTVTVYNVKDYGVLGDGKTDDKNAINNLLQKKKTPTNTEATEIVFPAGQYRISNTLKVFSNTTLTLRPGATIIFDNKNGGTVLNGMHFDSSGVVHWGLKSMDNNCAHGGYTQVHDVVINGGTWDCGGYSGSSGVQAFQLRHGNNITIKNLIVQNFTAHGLNLSGSNNVKVDNIVMRLAWQARGDSKARAELNEAIHLDFMNTSGEGNGSPLDNTPCKNITITNSIFDGVYAGIGQHVHNAKHSSGIVISKCTFKNIKGGNCINIYDSDGCTVKDCTLVSGASTFARIASSKNVVISKNTITSPSSKGIYAFGGVNVTVSRNVLTNAGAEGILFENTNAVVKGNTVSGSRGNGIHIGGSQSVSVTVVDNQSSSSYNIGTKKEIYIDSNCKKGTIANNGYGPRGIYISKNAKVSSSGNGRWFTAKWQRLYGQNRYDTMQVVVQEGWEAKKRTVVVATGSNFKDALSAAGLAGLYNAPIILTDGKKLTSQAKAELQRLMPDKVFIAGGTAAISKEVYSEIKSVTKVDPERLWGDNSVLTSVKLADAGVGQWSSTAILATNASFKDALSAAPVAYAKKMPIYLTNGKVLDQEVISSMRQNGIRKVVIVGGEVAIKPIVANVLKNSGFIVDRKWGSNGVRTSQEIAKWAIKDLGMSANKMGVATSWSFPDALSGAALCGSNNAVLVLADDKALLNASFPKNYKSQISRGYVFGGVLAVGNKTWSALAAATG